jgi:hypothetical protein
LGAAVGWGAFEAGELGAGGVETDLEPFDFAEPAVGAGLGDAFAKELITRARYVRHYAPASR